MLQRHLSIQPYYKMASAMEIADSDKEATLN